MSQSRAASNQESDSVFQRFFHWEAAGSIVLLAATIVALVWANSPWAESYHDLTHTYLGISWGEHAFKLSLQHWVNDALMVVFFFVVGLEIKREMVLGQLSSFRQSVLPVAAAIGGMVVPAAIYIALNAGGEGASGWGVPMATDIAFALGIMALFGTRAPIGLKVFLTALAIADDLGAVLVIALFYTEKVRLGALVVAAVFLFMLFVASNRRVRRVGVYVFLVLGVWIAIFASGVHATVAGILVALMIPVRARIDPEKFFSTAEESLATLRKSDLTRDSMVDDEEQMIALEELHGAAGDMAPPGPVLEHYLHLPQAFLILPLFALFNAGVVLGEGLFETLANPISIGIVLGLVVGKQLGVWLFSWLAIRSGYADMPEGVTWAQIWGVSCLAGVGFTMSLFVSELAFKDPELVSEAKVGILVASLIAGVWGYLVLARSLPQTGEK
ncbi:MAG: Na+/H+ antiporter NhaA [Acidobacteria bacterium]|nr:MAG: Na+/H+ antiporter NhaA [Acidobacteriota bacterium]